ncbi:MAG: site-specific integrase [Thermoplasmata archaeon]
MASSPARLEASTLPHGEWWWTERAKRYANEKRDREGWSEVCRYNTFRVLRVWPDRFEQLGFDRPSAPHDVTAPMVRAWKIQPLGKLGGVLQPSSAFQSLWILRGFLRWSRCSIAEDPSLWKYANGEPVNRRWLTKEQLGTLLNASAGRARVLVALAGFNGLRRIEISRLTVGSIDMSLPTPSMRVHGKGRNGGKWRTIPVSPVAHAELLPFVTGRRVTDCVYPWHYGTAYKDVRSAGLAAGIPIVSMHDLRRSFGRHAYYAGMDLVQLRNLYGHTSVDMTAHYIGLDDLEMRSGLRRFTEALAPFVGGGR